jgi:hypothetical protein
MVNFIAYQNIGRRTQNRRVYTFRSKYYSKTYVNLYLKFFIGERGGPSRRKLESPMGRPHTSKVVRGHTGNESKRRAPHRALN